MKDDFVDWLQAELDKRGWNQATLARAGISSSHVSRIMNRERDVGEDSCRVIAKLFGMPEEEVFRRAGLLSEKRGDAAGEALIVARFSELSQARRTQLLEYSQFLAELEARSRRGSQENGQ